jgi:hypothetical protein
LTRKQTSSHPTRCGRSPYCPLPFARLPPKLPSGCHDEWRPEPVAVPRWAAHREPRRGRRVAGLTTPAAARQRECRPPSNVIALASLVVEYRHREAEVSRPPTCPARTPVRAGLTRNQCQFLRDCIAWLIALRPPLTPSRVVVVVILLTAPLPPPVHALGSPGAAPGRISALRCRADAPGTQRHTPGTGDEQPTLIDKHVPAP